MRHINSAYKDYTYNCFHAGFCARDQKRKDVRADRLKISRFLSSSCYLVRSSNSTFYRMFQVKFLTAGSRRARGWHVLELIGRLVRTRRHAPRAFEGRLRAPREPLAGKQVHKPWKFNVLYGGGEARERNSVLLMQYHAAYPSILLRKAHIENRHRIIKKNTYCIERNLTAWRYMTFWYTNRRMLAV